MKNLLRSDLSRIIICFLVVTLVSLRDAYPDSGYEAWLRYIPMRDSALVKEYRDLCSLIYTSGNSEIIGSCLAELKSGLGAMTGTDPVVTRRLTSAKIVIGKAGDIPKKIYGIPENQINSLNSEGFIIKTTGKCLVIIAKEDIGLLYGTFHLLRLMQMGEHISDLNIFENPRTKLRLLNHWDNPGNVPKGIPSIERGYAGASIFKWEELPAINSRYADYARLLASVGINGAVVNNVNTAKNGLEGWKLLTPEYLPKLKALASEFRKFGIRLFISVNFFSPVLISGMSDADPSNPAVKQWWINKVAEIYSEIPDFGGFLVKADSEGEPGPIKYGKTQADGANLIASAFEPFGGLLFWRAFVYGNKDQSPDRACQAYGIFKPLDGHFAPNAIVQIKNGPIDFQVREPVSPLFGNMPETNQMLELQITQEYTGHDKHVCYLVPQWKEILDFDTYAKGSGSTVSKIIDGSMFNYKYSGIAGVSNIGDDINWTGHLLAQANFFGFGRIAWNPALEEEQITDEWIRLTFGGNIKILSVVKDILHSSLKTYEDYTSPLGVGLMCNGGSTGHEGHFTPAPSSRTSYHKADRMGVGYDRTSLTGSGFTGQYYEPAGSVYESPELCPDEFLLFFHHVPYSYKLKSGKTVIRHIYDSHNEGVENVREYYRKWQTLEGLIDEERYEKVLERLKGQISYAEVWRDSINTYFLKLSAASWPGNRFAGWDYNHMIRVNKEIKNTSSPYYPAFHELMDEAERALTKGPYSVTYKKMAPPGGTKNDYMSQGPYWWPDTTKPDGLPFIRHDGLRYPEAGIDRNQLGNFMESIRVLSLGWFFTNDSSYAVRAEYLLKVWFIDHETKMNPHLEFAQSIPGITKGRGIGIIDVRGMYNLVDAITLLESSGIIDPGEIKQIKDWFSEFFIWLTTSSNGKDEDDYKNNHSVAFDVIVSSIARFLGNDEYAAKKISAMPARRIDPMIESDGRQPEELIRTNAFGYSVSNLGNFFDAGETGLKTGVNIFGYKNPEGGSLRRALDFLTGYIGRENEWKWQQIGGFERTENSLGLLIRRAARYYDEPRYRKLWEEKFADKMKSDWSLLVTPGLE